jgi:DNA-damage-inducible protein D
MRVQVNLLGNTGATLRAGRIDLQEFRMSKLPKKKAAKGESIAELLRAFEDAKHIDDHDVEFWQARELAPLLGYKRWENFETAIGRAKVACQNVGEDVADHFREVTKMIEVGKGAHREHSDYELTRFASYLIALNGDPHKDEIAAAQTYFAVQTRRQEIADIAERQRPALSEDERRVLLRDEIKQHNKSLASAAKSHGVAKSVEYAVFQNEGYKGLYGGLDKGGIHAGRSSQISKTSLIICPAHRSKRRLQPEFGKIDA